MTNLKLIAFLAIVFISCSNTENKTNANDNQTSISTNDTANAACQICMMENELADLEKKSIEYSVQSKSKPCFKKYLDETEVKLDSLTKVREELLVKFNFTYDQASEKCKKSYPIKIKDTDKRESLLVELYYWNSNPSYFQIIDTLCETPYIENGKYGVKHRGELLWATKEEYEEHFKKLMYNQNQLQAFYQKKKKDITSQLTGIENPDEFCIEMMIRETNPIMRVKSNYDKYSELMKSKNEELDSLVAKCGEF